MSESSETSSRRPVRSFVIRAGRLTTSQRNAIEQHWQDFVVDYQPQLLDLSSLFSQPGPLTVEIGFGMGDSLLEMAMANPARNYLGIEVHKPGVGKLLHGIVANDVSNIRILCHDAVEVLTHCLGAESIDRLLLLFPDPWHKKKHHKRRIVQPAFIELVRSRLQAGGTFHLATDWQPYAEHMLEVLEESALTNTQGEGTYWQKPERPETKFERRGQRLGHGVWDLLYQKS